MAKLQASRRDEGTAPASAPNQPLSVNTNPRDIAFWKLIAEDYRRHGRSPFSCGFWVLFVHRFGNWRFDVKPALLRLPLNVLYRFLFDLGRLVFGIHLSCTVPVGRRVMLLHHGGMYLGARRIGNDVLLKHNTTLGTRIGTDENLPTIEDNVEVGVGATILGGVTVGHDSFVAANSLVLKDVPPGSLAMGVPARAFPKLET